MASMPTVTTKSWSVSCESLNVADSAAILTAVKSMTPMTLLWDETSTTDNQTRVNATFARKGQAYLNDLSITYNRENATKSLQWTGTGELSTVSSGDLADVIPLGSYTKGQFVRLFLGSDNTATPAAVIAAAQSLTLHVSVSLESSATKDTTGDWDVQEPTAISYDISTNALMRSGETITSQVAGKTITDLATIYQNGTPVKWQIANVSGDNQRTKGAVIASGSVVLTQLTLNGQNAAKSTYDAQLTGYGIYEVAA